MKVYIAGPMTGLPEFNFPAFRAAERDLLARGYEVLNPVHISDQHDPEQAQPWDWYMRHALRMVCDADGIALLPGWGDSRGARLEYHIAGELRIPRLPLAYWLADDADARIAGALS